MDDLKGEYFRCNKCGVKYDHMGDFAKTLGAPKKGDWVETGECRICSGELNYLNIKEVIEQVKDIIISDLFDHGRDDEDVENVIDVEDFRKTSVHHIIAFLWKSEYIV